MHALKAYYACIKKKETIQYTIRTVLPEVNEAVREYSVREGCSLNQAVLAALRKGSGASDERYLDLCVGHTARFNAVLSRQTLH